ncbi:sulfatase-like hydrolase/transferase [candidate division KSB1 bacterium]
MGQTGRKLNGSEKPSRREFLKKTAGAAIAAPFIAGCSKTTVNAGKRRNIVFILSDDHRYDAMSFMGHPLAQTPNMDRLARDGIHFQNAFVTTSLCSPSRASILSGQYAHTHGVLNNSTLLPEDTLTFPEALQGAGYRTGFVGKWHMGGSSDDPRPGFDHWVSFRGQGPYFDPTFNVDGEHVERQGYTADLITEYSVDFVEKNKDRPFMLYMSHKNVHGMFEPAPRHAGKLKNTPVPHPATMADTKENYRGKPKWLKGQRNTWHGVDGMYNNRIDFDTFGRLYGECLMGLDDSVGVLTETLEKNGLLDDTLIIYMGDNGFMFGEHGLIDKRAMYEPSIRVPFLAHCPALSEGGRKVDELTLNIDVAPTIMTAAGVDIPAQMQGQSFLPLVEGRETDWRGEFVYVYFWERAYPQTPTVLGLRTDKYSYMRYHGVFDINELYDMEVDPDQTNNLLGGVDYTTQGGPFNGQIQDRELRGLVDELEKKLFGMLGETGAMIEPSWRV